MPPKPKFTREEIVETALRIVSEKGIEGLTARELGDGLGSSARPIFTVFKNMEELQEEVRLAAMRYFENFDGVTEEDIPVFKRIGMQMVLFAVREPKLYRLLFMQENHAAVSFKELFGKPGSNAQLCMDAICRDYHLSPEEAENLFENVWIYTFGVGTLCACGVCSFPEEKIAGMLTTEFKAIMTLLKSGKESEKEDGKRNRENPKTGTEVKESK